MAFLLHEKLHKSAQDELPSCYIFHGIPTIVPNSYRPVTINMTPPTPDAKSPTFLKGGGGVGVGSERCTEVFFLDFNLKTKMPLM